MNRLGAPASGTLSRALRRPDVFVTVTTGCQFTRSGDTSISIVTSEGGRKRGIATER